MCVQANVPPESHAIYKSVLFMSQLHRRMTAVSLLVMMITKPRGVSAVVSEVETF
jgi:hypothetical protein